MSIELSSVYNSIHSVLKGTEDHLLTLLLCIHVSELKGAHVSWKNSVHCMTVIGWEGLACGEKKLVHSKKMSGFTNTFKRDKII